jgi:hypothetical protein
LRGPRDDRGSRHWRNGLLGDLKTDHLELTLPEALALLVLYRARSGVLARALTRQGKNLANRCTDRKLEYISSELTFIIHQVFSDHG